MKHLTLHLCEFMQKSPYNSAELTSTNVKAKAMKFSSFATEITQIIASSLLCMKFFFLSVEAMEANSGNVNYGKKFKHRSDEVFNADKEIEAMERLMLHRIASSLYRFIASVAQLCCCGIVHFVKFSSSNLKYAAQKEPKMQRPLLFANLTKNNFCF